MSVYIALIRTHHITSRKKVAALKLAAERHGCFALLHSGGSPGIMYVEGSEKGVKSWVSQVRDLRYKDYQLVARPGECERDLTPEEPVSRLEEVNSVKDFAAEMGRKNLLSWWRKAMGYTTV